MSALFRCQTIEQHKIRCWLEAQGLTQADVTSIGFPARNRVRITNPAGQYMVLELRDGQVRIDQTKE